MMAGDTSLSRIVYRKDERGVILDSAVVIGDDEAPEGFEDAAEYESLEWTTREAAPVDESKLTQSESEPDLRQTVDVILGGNQEGPSDPGGLTGDDRNAAEAEAAEAEAEEPAEGSEAADEVAVPPKGGAGSSAPAWAAYAAAKDVEVPEDATRDEIIAALEAKGIPTD